MRLVGTILVAGAFAVGAADVVDLAGEWELADMTGGESIKAAVPGGVHDALLRAGKIDDIYYGSNETNALWIGRHDWKFCRSFDVPAGFIAKKDVVLRLEDCDTFAKISVNGRVVGETSNRFRRYTFDVKRFLKPGENEVSLLFRSPETVADERRKEAGRAYPMSNVMWAKNQALIRKPACHAGWDWGPSVQTIGPCGTVELIASDSPRIDYVYTAQTFSDDFSHCTLDVFADLSDGTTVTNRIEIDDPPLWWPNGAGERRFYEYAVKVGDETVRRRIGLRKVEIDNTPDVDSTGKPGARMTVKVNGRELFMKGANWIPCDAIESRQTPERYRDLLESAAAANMNMIRLWGGGQFEKDAFYDICDELGLLVWHDHMFSCAVYPADDAFLAEVAGELAHQLRRLRDHASIALWCGDNECVGALKWFSETKAAPDFYKAALVKRHALQADMVAKYDPARMFWPSSPCAGPGNFADNWKNDSQGDMHNWQVWHANRPFDAYYEYSPRFCSEFGYQSFPSPEVAETFCDISAVSAGRGLPSGHAGRVTLPAGGRAVAPRPPQTNSDFEWHQKNPGGNRRIRETMLRYFKPPKDFESELLLSQFQQGMAIKMAVEGWRAQRPRCMGTLFWQLNDNWPVASWSSIEYGGKWKPLHHMARRFYAPVAVVAQPEIVGGKADVTRGRIFALNDTAETVEGELLVEYWTYDGKIVSAETRHVALPPGSSTAVGEFSAGARVPRDRGRASMPFLVMTLKTPCGEYQNDWHFGFYKDMPLARANIAVSLGRAVSAKPPCQITLSTDRPAFFVWANVRGVKGEFDDNCLTLLPGRPRTLTFSGLLDQRRLSVTSLERLGEETNAPAMPLEWNTSYDTAVPYEVELSPAKLQALAGVDHSAGFVVMAKTPEGERPLEVAAFDGRARGTVRLRFAVPDGTSALECRAGEGRLTKIDSASVAGSAPLNRHR